MDQGTGGDVRPGEEVRLSAPLQGTVVLLPVPVGSPVSAGTIVVVLESMKMEHVVRSPVAGTLAYLDVDIGGLVADGAPLAVVEAGEATHEAVDVDDEVDLDHLRPDLAELLSRRALVMDTGRPEVVDRRHERGRRTARENIDDLCDPGSFTEYGSLAIAAQRNRRDLQELIERTPADGLVAGIGRVNGDQFGPEGAACAALSMTTRFWPGPRASRTTARRTGCSS